MSPPRKKKRVEKKAPKPKVRDTIKAVQVKKPQKKQMVISDDNGVVDVDPMPKPCQTLPKARKVAPITESDDDQLIAAHKLSKWNLPTLTDNNESDVPSPRDRRVPRWGGKARERRLIVVPPEKTPKAPIRITIGRTF